MPSAPLPIIRDPDIIEGYLTDASNTRGRAEGLVRPRSTGEVAALLAWCQAEGQPVTVTAQRTSTTGAPVPAGGLLLSTELLNRVLDVDYAEGGVLLGEYQAHVAAQGWMFPPDPTSRHECSLGAAIACNASGARSFKYGPTRPWVVQVEAVLPDGTIVEADRSTPIPDAWPTASWVEPGVKTAAGFFPADNLLDLLIGQEGVLGIITRARLKLCARPEGVLSLIAFFPDVGGAISFVDTARAFRRGGSRPGAGPPLDPSAIEYFDRHALDLVRARVPDIPDDASAALFIEVEHDGELPLEVWWDALEASDALVDDTIVADDPQGWARLRAVRHAVPAGVNEIVVANGMPKIGTDFAVPDAALPQMMAAYDAVSLSSVCFGHIGDNHLHLNLLPRTSDELAQAKALYRSLALRAVSLGGTVSAEHGIGKLKRGLLAEMVGPEVLGRFRALKAAVDPAWILGRGTMLAPEP